MRLEAIQANRDGEFKETYQRDLQQRIMAQPSIRQAHENARAEWKRREAERLRGAAVDISDSAGGGVVTGMRGPGGVEGSRCKDHGDVRRSRAKKTKVL